MISQVDVHCPRFLDPNLFIASSFVSGPLFQTMVQLLLKDVDGACVLMTQSFSYDTQTEEAIDELCVSLNLVRSILSCALTDGGIRLQKFSFTTSTNADT